MVNKKKLIVMSGMLCIALAGCTNSSSETGESKTESSSSESALETEKEDDKKSDDSDKASDSESESEKTTLTESEPDESSDEPAVTDPDESVREKYIRLMQLSVEDARREFEVAEDKSLSSDDFDSFMNDIFISTATSDRLTLDQYLVDPEGFGIEDIGSITYDPGHMLFSDEELEESKNMNLEQLKEMLAYPYEELTGRQKLVFDKLYYNYLISLWQADVKDYAPALGYSSCVISNIAITFYEYSFDTEENLKTYARVMDYLPELFLEIPDHVKKQMEELDYAPTDYMIETALSSIEELTDTDNNPFIDGYNAKVKELGLSADKEKKYIEDNEKFYTEEVIPSLNKLYEEIEKLSGSNPDGKPLCDYEGGLDYYEFLVESNVGAGMSVDELMELLENKLDKNVGRLTKYAMLNYQLYEDYYEGNVSVPGDDDPEKILDIFADKLSGDFPGLDDVKWSISHLPKSLEVDGVLAYYVVPRIDLPSLNVIRVNDSALSDDSLSMFTTIAHEGYPGHMLQFHVQQSCGALPVEQLISHSSYSEGWAMYVEDKALDCTDISEAMKNIIILDSDINYDISAFADLAVNGKGWDADKLDSFFEELGLSAGIGQVLYQSVTGDPGIYLPYSLGKIITGQVIDDYVDSTGAEYKEAYEEYLKVGSAPYSVVRKFMGFDY